MGYQYDEENDGMLVLLTSAMNDFAEVRVLCMQEKKFYFNRSLN